MRKIAPHLKQATTQIANIWLLEDTSGRKFLIDSGHPLERPQLLANLWMAGIRMPGDLAGILLTHRHSDHAGNAAWLRKRFKARVICHENDAAPLSGRVSAPTLVRKDPDAISQFGKQRFYEKWLAAYEDRAPAFCEVDEVFTEGAWKWDFKVVPVPGHTEGSVMLYHEPTRTLFSGDAILVGYPWSRRNKTLHLAEPAFSQDAQSCHLAVRRFLRQLPPVDYLCSGHGPVLDEAVQNRLLRLLKDRSPELAAR